MSRIPKGKNQERGGRAEREKNKRKEARNAMGTFTPRGVHITHERLE